MSNENYVPFICGIQCIYCLSATLARMSSPESSLQAALSESFQSVSWKSNEQLLLTVVPVECCRTTMSDVVVTWSCL